MVNGTIYYFRWFGSPQDADFEWRLSNEREISISLPTIERLLLGKESFRFFRRLQKCKNKQRRRALRYNKTNLLFELTALQAQSGTIVNRSYPSDSTTTVKLNSIQLRSPYSAKVRWRPRQNYFLEKMNEALGSYPVNRRSAESFPKRRTLTSFPIIMTSVWKS